MEGDVVDDESFEREYCRSCSCCDRALLKRPAAVAAVSAARWARWLRGYGEDVLFAKSLPQLVV